MNISDLIAKSVASEKLAGGGTKVKGVSAMARMILTKLREKGAELVGLTAVEVQVSLNLNKTVSQVRDDIRAAQILAWSSGDLVYCRDSFTSIDGKGRPIPLTTKVSRYFIVPGSLLSDAKPEDIKALRDMATDWVYKSDVKVESTRAVLAQMVLSARPDAPEPPANKVASK